MPDFGNATVYSQTDASNNTATDPGFPEGMAPSRVNNAARALQGAAKRFRDHRSFTVTSGGSAAVQTLTYTVAPDLQTGDEFSFIAGFACPGAMTLNPNALGAVSVKKLSAGSLVDPAVNDFVANDKVRVSYDGTYYVIIMIAALNSGVAKLASQNLFTKAQEFAKGAAVASAATTDIWTPGDGNTIPVSGTATITSLGTAPQAGTTRRLLMTGAATFTNNAAIIVPGGVNYVAAVGDIIDVTADTTTIARLAITKASGQAVVANSPTRVVSGQSTFAISTANNVAHGLGAVPAVAIAYIQCSTTDIGYSVGDRVYINPAHFTNGNTGGANIVADATNVTFVVGSGLTILNKGTFTQSLITIANWRFGFVASL